MKRTFQQELSDIYNWAIGQDGGLKLLVEEFNLHGLGDKQEIMGPELGIVLGMSFAAYMDRNGVENLGSDWGEGELWDAFYKTTRKNLKKLEEHLLEHPED